MQQNSCPLPATSSCHRLLRSEAEASFEPEGSLGNIHLFWSCGCRVPRSPSAECAHHAHSWGELQDLSKGQHLGNRLLLADAASASQTPCAWEAVGKRPAPSTLHPAAFTALPSQARAGSSSEPPLMQRCISAAGWCITEGSRLEQKVIYGISNNLRTRRVKQATSTLFCVKNFSVSHTNPTFTENSFCF